MALRSNRSKPQLFGNKRSSTKEVRKLLVDGSEMARRRVGLDKTAVDHGDERGVSGNCTTKGRKADLRTRPP